MTFVQATSLHEALHAVANGARPIAGGSDLVVGARQGKAPLPGSLVAIDRIEELAGIEHGQDRIRIGAGVTHERLQSDASIVAGFTALADAAALVGSPATRHVGTLGGNVMNASPAMDTGAPLVVFDAAVELRSAEGSRVVTPTELWTGPGTTTARDEELCVSIELPHLAARSGSAYVRLEYRRAMEIAIVGAAAMVTLAEDGTLMGGSVALTAVAPTIVAVEGAPEALAGKSPEDGASAVASAASGAAAPISDVRASEEYRRHIVGVMARRAVEAAARRAAGEQIAVPVNRSIGIGASG